MVVRTVVVALGMLSVALTGCTSDADAGENAQSQDMMEAESEGIPLPEWQVGDWWTFDYTYHFDTILAESVDMVVTEITDTHAIVDADQESWAFLEARGDFIQIGPQRLSDLAAQQTDGSHSLLWQWPLVDGAAWTHEWYGESVDAVGTLESNGRYRVDVTYEGGVVWSYWYSEQTEWFDGFEVVDADGAMIIELQVTKGSGAYSDEAVRAEVFELVHESGTGQNSDPAVGLDTSDATEDSDIWLDMQVSCQQGRIFMGIGSVETVGGLDPGDEGVIWDEICPFEDRFYGVAVDNVHEGSDRVLGWGYALDIESVDAVWRLHAWLANYERIPIAA